MNEKRNDELVRLSRKKKTKFHVFVSSLATRTRSRLTRDKLGHPVQYEHRCYCHSPRLEWFLVIPEQCSASPQVERKEMDLSANVVRNSKLFSFTDVLESLLASLSVDKILLKSPSKLKSLSSCFPWTRLSRAFGHCFAYRVLLLETATYRFPILRSCVGIPLNEGVRHRKKPIREPRSEILVTTKESVRDSDASFGTEIGGSRTAWTTANSVIIIRSDLCRYIEQIDD